MYGQNETPLPQFPFTHLTTDAVREAKQLHDEATEARALVGKIAAEGHATYDELLAAKQELEAQRLKPARDVKAELRLADKVRTHEILADPVPFRQRSSNAAIDAEQAVRRYRSYVRDHGMDLLEELRPEAEDTAQELADAFAKIQPYRDARGAVAARVEAVTSCFHEGQADHREWWSVPANETTAPMPPEATVKWWIKQNEPQSESALPASDQTWTFA